MLGNNAKFGGKNTTQTKNSCRENLQTLPSEMGLTLIFQQLAPSVLKTAKTIVFLIQRKSEQLSLLQSFS